jgi:hypothetical protein
VLTLLLAGAEARAEHDLLPDAIIVESWLDSNEADWSTTPGGVHVRLSNGTANAGEGPLHVYGVLPGNPDGTQDVYQRIFRDDGTWWDRLAGVFVFHRTHNHIHFEGWAAYRLRERLPNGDVGPILVEGEKTSFSLQDTLLYDVSLPGAPPAPVYIECASTVQGISAGWQDIYTRSLPGQSVKLCGTTGGELWLEAEVDPDDSILEVDETHNVARVIVEVPPRQPATTGSTATATAWSTTRWTPAARVRASRPRPPPATTTSTTTATGGSTIPTIRRVRPLRLPRSPTGAAAWASSSRWCCRCGSGADGVCAAPPEPAGACAALRAGLEAEEPHALGIRRRSLAQPVLRRREPRQLGVQDGVLRAREAPREPLAPDAQDRAAVATRSRATPQARACASAAHSSRRPIPRPRRPSRTTRSESSAHGRGWSSGSSTVSRPSTPARPTISPPCSATKSAPRKRRQRPSSRRR